MSKMVISMLTSIVVVDSATADVTKPEDATAPSEIAEGGLGGAGLHEEVATIPPLDAGNRSPVLTSFDGFDVGVLCPEGGSR